MSSISRLKRNLELLASDVEAKLRSVSPVDIFFVDDRFRDVVADIDGLDATIEHEDLVPGMPPLALNSECLKYPTAGPKTVSHVLLSATDPDLSGLANGFLYCARQYFYERGPRNMELTSDRFRWKVADALRAGLSLPIPLTKRPAPRTTVDYPVINASTHWNRSIFHLLVAPALNSVRVSLPMLSGTAQFGVWTGWNSKHQEPHFVQEANEELLGDKAQLVRGHIRSPLILSGYQFGSGIAVSGNQVSFLRGRLRSQKDRSRRRRLFISRSDASTRRLVNEAATATFLEYQFGFETVRLGTLSFREQVDLFSNAEAIVAVHGAGLVHMIFAAEGCVVVEILASNDVRPHYYRLASSLGHRYAYFLGEGSEKAARDVEVRLADFVPILFNHLKAELA